MPGVILHVRMICTDERCAEILETWCSLEELEVLACECGCALDVIGWLAEVPPAEPAFELPLAA